MWCINSYEIFPRNFYNASVVTFAIVKQVYFTFLEYDVFLNNHTQYIMNYYFTISKWTAIMKFNVHTAMFETFNLKFHEIDR